MSIQVHGGGGMAKKGTRVIMDTQRERERIHGTIENEVGGSVLTQIQLIGTVSVATAEGLVIRRPGEEVTCLDFA